MPRAGDALGFRVLVLEQDFILINKAAGLGFHDERPLQEHAQYQQAQVTPGLCSLLAQELERMGESNCQVFPVHRLDKVTSGLLLFARNADAAAQLSEEFAHHRVEKYYLALSDRKPKKKQGSIVGDMIKARRGSWKLLASKQAPAKTQFYSHSIAPGLRMFCLRPYSGKTHQLRVALKSLSSPICGDQNYAGSAAAKNRPFDRVFLHSYILRFNYDGQPYHYSCLPDLDLSAETDRPNYRFDWWINDELKEALTVGFGHFEQAHELHWSMAKQ